MDKKENKFEALYSEFEDEMTKEDLDIILKFILDINSKMVLARFGVIIPFAVFMYSCLQYFKTLPANYYLLSTVMIVIAFLVFSLDFINLINKFQSMETFKEYFRIRRKMTADKEAAP